MARPERSEHSDNCFFFGLRGELRREGSEWRVPNAQNTPTTVFFFFGFKKISPFWLEEDAERALWLEPSPHTNTRLVYFSIAIFAKRQLLVPKFQKLTIVPCVGRHLCNAGRGRARQWSLKKEKGSYPARTRAIIEVYSASTPTLLKGVVAS